MKKILLTLILVSAYLFAGLTFQTSTGSKSFTQKVRSNKSHLVGKIPAGINNLYIKLQSDKDLDIQLYDKKNIAIVSWSPKGFMYGANKQSITYHGMKIEWSGYNGTEGNKGHEYLKISGKISEILKMKIFGFQSGTANITYSWGEIKGCTKEYAPACGITNPCPPGTQCFVAPIYKTFGNMCMLDVAKAEFVHEGTCKK